LERERQGGRKSYRGNLHLARQHQKRKSCGEKKAGHGAKRSISDVIRRRKERKNGGRVIYGEVTGAAGTKMERESRGTK